MISFSLFTALAIAIAVEAICLSNNPQLHVRRELQRRALPKEHGCPTCPGEKDGDWLATYDPTRASPGKEDESQIYPADWYPQACGARGFVCIELDVCLNYVNGGFQGGIWAHYTKQNGRQIYILTYWQSTYLFTGAGATFEIYPAHCTNYFLSKGSNTEVVVNGQTIKQGGGENCEGDASNVEIGLIQFLYISPPQCAQ